MNTSVPQVKFHDINSKTSGFALSILQNYKTLIPTDRELLQKIFTFINIVDVNKDANNKISVTECLKPFYNQYIQGITNIPDTYSLIQQQLHNLENHYIPTLRDIKLVGDQQTGMNRGYKTMFIVPLLSYTSSVTETSIAIKENFLRKEYSKCTVDVAFNPRKYNPEIQIHETAGSYIDPGDRTDDVDKYLPVNTETIDLTEYGLPGIAFTATKQRASESKPEFIDITIDFDKSIGPKFENIETLKCSINRRQKLQGEIQIEFTSSESKLEFSSPNIFDGNGVKNDYIPVHCNNKNRDDKISSNVFLLGKLLGDLLQIVYVKQFIPEQELNQFILFTNDLVVGLRCVMLKIPFLLSTNYREVSSSNCNVLYFYDDITAIQQLTLIIEEKQKMIRNEINNLDGFIQAQLSSENLYIKSHIKSSISGRNRMVVDEVMEKYREYLDPLTSQIVTSIEQLKAKLISLEKDFDALVESLKKFSSETEIPDFSRIVRLISSIKIDALIKVAIRKDKTVHLFNSNKKLITVKISPITIASSSSSVLDTLNGIIDTLNDSRIPDMNNPAKQVILKEIIQNYERQALTIYNQMKRKYDDDERIKKLIEASEKKRRREEESTPEKNIPIPMQSLIPNQDSDDEDDDMTLTELAKRAKTQQKGGLPQDIDVNINANLENIYNIFYSYCNYHGIIVTKNSSFRQLIEYIFSKTRENPSTDFSLDDSTIAEIFNSEKSAINKILEVTSDNDTAINHDIEEENMSSALTDPDMITQDVIKQITVIIQESESQTQSQIQSQTSTAMDTSEEREPDISSISTPKSIKKRSLQLRSPEKENYQQVFIKEQSEPTTTTKSKKKARLRLGEGLTKRKSINEKRKTKGRNKIKKAASQKRNKKREKKSKNKHKQENKGKREKTRESRNPTRNPTRNPSRKKSKK
jgi:hypothetical protein